MGRYVLTALLLVVPALATDPPTKQVPPGQVRVGVRTVLNGRGQFVQELTFETADPTDMSLLLYSADDPMSGSGLGTRTERRPGEAAARGGMVVGLVYLSADKDGPFVKRSGLRVTFNPVGPDGKRVGGSGGPGLLPAPDAAGLDDLLKAALKPGDYPYPPADGKGLEVMTVGGYRIALQARKATGSPKAK